MRWILNLVVLMLPVLSYAQFDSNAASDWRIMKTQWTETDEAMFGDFVSRIGAAVERRAVSYTHLTLPTKA